MNKKTKKPGFIKAQVARWLGIPSDAGDGTGYNLGDGRLGLYNNSNQLVNSTSIMRLSAAWACVTLLSDTISTLPLNFYRKTATGREEATDHRLYRVLKSQPNADVTANFFFQVIVASLLLRGVGYAEKLMSAGYCIGLEFLNRDCLSITKDADGKLRYRYTENGKTREIPEARIFKIPGFSLDGKTFLSAIAYGANVFGGAQAAEEAAQTTFKNGLMKTVGFKMAQILKKEQREEFRENFEKIAGAINAGKPALLEGGMEAQEIGINPTDAQLLESRAFSVEEICSWFRVQPFMIGRASQGQTNWGTGIEQQMIGFVTFTLGPWLTKIEQAINNGLLRPEEKGVYYAKFSVQGLLRGDSAARKEFYASALQNGWMNRNQVRALEDLPPIEGGDVYTVQSNLIPINKLGETDASETVKNAFMSWLDEGEKNES